MGSESADASVSANRGMVSFMLLVDKSIERVNILFVDETLKLISMLSLLLSTNDPESRENMETTPNLPHPGSGSCSGS